MRAERSHCHPHTRTCPLGSVEAAGDASEPEYPVCFVQFDLASNSNIECVMLRCTAAKCDSGRLRDTGARHKMGFVGTSESR